jgi:hypothetical protein
MRSVFHVILILVSLFVTTDLTAQILDVNKPGYLHGGDKSQGRGLKEKVKIKTNDFAFRLEITSRYLKELYKLDSIAVAQSRSWMPSRPPRYEIKMYKYDFDSGDSATYAAIWHTAARFTAHVLGGDTTDSDISVALITKRGETECTYPLFNILYIIMDRAENPWDAREKVEKIMTLPYYDIPHFAGIELGVTIVDSLINYSCTVQFAEGFQAWEPERAIRRIKRLMKRGADTDCAFTWRSFGCNLRRENNFIRIDGKMTVKKIPLYRD